MPVEIRELIIRAVVSGNGQSNETSKTSVSGEDKVKWLSECVEETLQILKEKQER